MPDFQYIKTMTTLKPHSLAALLFVILPICCLTCSAKQSIETQDLEKEIWELHVTGEVAGKLKMVLIRTKIEKEIFTITGQISGRLKDYRAGTGMGDYQLEGKIENEIFKANFSGNSSMEAGPSPTSGRLNGTIYTSKGSGKYSVLYAFGSSHGDYIMRKIHSY